MRIVYEPGEWKVRGENYPYIHIAYRDEEKGKQFTTDESDTACYFQATNQYRERHGIPYRDEIVALRERYGVSATKMAMIPQVFLDLVRIGISRPRTRPRASTVEACVQCLR